MTALPAVAVSFFCPECHERVAVRHRRRDGEPFVGCTGYPLCKWAAPYDAAVQAVAHELAEAQQALEDKHTDDTPRARVTAKDLRQLLAWSHPDKHGGADIPAHEVAVRVGELLDRVKSEARSR